MRRRTILAVVCAARFAACGAPSQGAALELGAPFSDGVVLQREMKVPVWGTATAGNEVMVSFAGGKSTATVGTDGRWLVRLPEMAASKEGRELVVTEREPGWFGSTVDTKTVGDVLVGEVWFACGQSNTECPIWHDGNSRYRDGKGAMMTAMTRLPCVRCVKTPRVYGAPDRNKLRARWLKFVPENFVAGPGESHWKLLSGVAWYYARELYLALDVPVGIIDSSIGGTNIDAWTPRAGYEGCDPSIRPTADYKLHFGKEWKKECATKVITNAHQQPTVLFNAMVWDYAPMAMRGLIWYQGCHNAGESELYCAKMHALYAGWSRVFENPDLKLYFAQLAPWETSWLGLCMAQTKFAEEERNAAVAVTADVGNFDDIHPNDKETVAQRLALHALKRDYGFAIPEDDSPVAKGLTVKDGVATVAFDHVKTWYVYNRDMSLGAPFELAGTNGVWKAAKLVECGRRFENWQTFGLIEHPELHLKSDEVAEPVAVRYMGRDRTVTTLYNQASLPLGPFELALEEK